MPGKISHRLSIIGSLVAVAVGFSLAMIKFVVAYYSGSVAIFASAVDSWLDFMISVVNFFTLQAAAKPPDAEHRYGHGKFEAFAELMQGIFIACSGGYLAYTSIHRLIYGVEIKAELLGVAIMIFAMVVSYFLVKYLLAVAKKTGSLIIKTEAAHYSSDILANLAVIIGLIVVKYTGLNYFDPLISLFISVLILRAAWQLLTESHEVLTDKEMPVAVREEIIEIIETADPRIAGWHLLRTRQTGTESHIDFHLIFNQKISLLTAHDITEDLEMKIVKKIPNANVLIHMEPRDDFEKHQQDEQKKDEETGT